MPETSAYRVLIVENDPVIAIILEDLTRLIGCEVIGPTRSMSEAEKLVASHEIDIAVLDLDTDRQKASAVADALRQRSVRMIFTARNEASAAEASDSAVTLLKKPFPAREFTRNMGLIFRDMGPISA